MLFLNKLPVPVTNPKIIIEQMRYLNERFQSAGQRPGLTCCCLPAACAVVVAAAANVL